MIIYIVTLALISILSLIGFFIANKKSQALSNKKVIFYYLIFALLITACGCIGMSPTASRSMMYFVLLQFVFLGLGYLASYLYTKADMTGMEKSRWGGVFFVMVNAFVGMIGFGLLYNYFDHAGLAPYFALSVVPFVLPRFLATSFSTYQEIPQEIHKIWYFPVHADDIDFENIDTSTIYMLEVEYSKSVNDPRLTNTKLRAPVSMKFGDWYRSFIENYNYKFDSDPIHYLEEDGTPQGWIFYVKPSALGTPKYIDPELTIAQNKLSEKGIIIAKRVGIVQEEEPQSQY